MCIRDRPKFDEKKHRPKEPEKTEQVGVVRAKGKKPRAKKTKLQTKKKK